jgi:hypothetical protein
MYMFIDPGDEAGKTAREESACRCRWGPPPIVVMLCGEPAAPERQETP